jgi:hypothetical protein
MEKIMTCQQDCNQFDLAMELLIGLVEEPAGFI